MTPPCFRSTNLLSYCGELEAGYKLTNTGPWSKAVHDRGIGGPYGVVVRNSGLVGLVADTTNPSDQQHIINTQPLATEAVVRKLREAFYLMQEASWFADVFCGMNTESQGRVQALRDRLRVFPHIDVPDLSDPPKVERRPMTKEEAIEIAVRMAPTLLTNRREAIAEWVVDAILEAANGDRG